MAILTKIGMDKILRKIMEAGNLNSDMENVIQRLRDDFNERENFLNKYGKTYDGEDLDEYDYIMYETNDENEAKEWKEKYEEMKTRYIDRFFSGEDGGKKFEEIMNETREDVKRDSKPQTFDELLERIEG